MVSRDRSPSLVVVTSCSLRKRHHPANPPTFGDLSDTTRRAKALERLGELTLPACELYRGQHHVRVLRAVRQLRARMPDVRIGLIIVSGGYGALNECDPIVPYDATFSGLPTRVVLSRARSLGIREALVERLRMYEVALFLLGETYLAAIESPLRAAPLEIYFAPSRRELSGTGIMHVRVGAGEARSLKVAPRMAKAVLFERFAATVTEEGWSWALEALRAGYLLQHRM